MQATPVLWSKGGISLRHQDRHQENLKWVGKPPHSAGGIGKMNATTGVQS